MPEVSVIIPCYNQAVFLQEAVDSVLAQSFADWECIIVNDASPDDTAKLASSISGQDARISNISAAKNLGLAGARNLGIQHATGRYILPLDADDKIAPGYLEEAMAAFEQDSSTKLLYAKAAFFGNETGEWALPPYHYGLLFGRNPIYCSAIFKKEDWSRCKGYDAGLKKGLEDWDFWLRILTPESKVVQLPGIRFFYRKHAQSMIHDLLTDQHAFEQAKADMLIRHRDKWLSWSFNYLAPLLEQMQYQRIREQQLAGNTVSRWLYKLARMMAKAS
jgi:glycosyltransferase involved in cell wall biosynthesis